MQRTNNVLITGANRGIGLEFTRQYIAAGWRVHATCRNPSRAHELNRMVIESGKLLSVHQLDVTAWNDITQINGILMGKPLDMLINNAGVLGPKLQNFGNTDIDSWIYSMKVNAIAPLKLTENLIANLVLSPSPVVVNLTSKMGSISENTTGKYYIYRSTKSALNAVIHNMALDLSPKGIIVIAIHPGWVRTDMGGENAELNVGQSVTKMRSVIERVTITDSGKFLDLNGTTISW
ncbi:short-chain dehydrogenase [Achromatium sp. WMS2]|nr:short-chain dehydrogenase [Achromatium sp. WMS2]